MATGTGNQLSSRLLSVSSATALLKLPPRTADLKVLKEESLVDAIIL